jgi:hypothetical protein
MTGPDVVSHFWVAGKPFFSSTIFVAPCSVVPPSSATEPPSALTEEHLKVKPCATTLDFFDADGAKTNTVEIEFPADEVGLIELEPFMAGIKVEGGVQHSHLAITSPAGTRHLCRLSNGVGVALVQDPLMVRSRESSFIPLVLSAQKEQMLAFVNAGGESAQVSCRLFYGNRSPEWNFVVAPFGAKLVSIQEELLASQDDRSWEKGSTQAYVRITARHQACISCLIVERVPGESFETDQYRCLVAG